MATPVPSSCGCPSFCDNSLQSVTAGTRCGGPADSGRLRSISLWPPARSRAQPLHRDTAGAAPRDPPASEPADGQQLARCGRQCHGPGGSSFPLPPPVTQATEPRPTSYGLGSLGKAREARKLPEVAGNSHRSPGGRGGPGAAPCSQLQPRTAGQPRETLLHGHTRSLLSSAWFEARLRTGAPTGGFSPGGRGGAAWNQRPAHPLGPKQTCVRTGCIGILVLPLGS